MRVISVVLLLAQAGPLIEGLERFHQGDYAAAEADLEKALAQRDDARGRAFLALTRAATGRCEAAMTELSTQFAQTSDAQLRRLAGLGLVECYVARQRHKEAVDTAARLREMYPSDADVLYQSARVHMRTWNEILYDMFRRTPSSFRVNQLSAEIFETQGNYAAAIAEYRKAIEKNPKAINLHYRLGRALLMESHAPEALENARAEFEAELKLNPFDAVAEYQVAQIRLVQGKPDLAAPRLSRALEINGNFPEALVAFGKLKLEARQNDDAIRLLERAVELAPRSEAARYSLMVAYRNAGRQQDALRVKTEIDKLQKPPEGEFTEFLKKLGEKKP